MKSASQQAGNAAVLITWKCLKTGKIKNDELEKKGLSHMK